MQGLSSRKCFSIQFNHSYQCSIDIKIWNLQWSIKPQHNTTCVNVIITCVCLNSLTSKLSMKDNLAPWCFRHSKNTPIKLVKGSSNSCNMCQKLQVINWHHLMMFMDAHAIFTQFCLKVTSHVPPSHNNIQLSIMGLVHCVVVQHFSNCAPIPPQCVSLHGF
jgi:hypothetical protein